MRIYPLPGDPNETLPPRQLRGIPVTSSEEVLIRVYIVKAIDLAPADPNGLADPFVKVKLGKISKNSKDEYRPNTLNPIFGQ